jgi:glycosyltransferase involved in cell wall biosynthesis
MPNVTVIVATYNSSGSLRYALQSILNQTHSDFEVWVIGDACTDDSEQMVAAFNDERLKWFNLPERCGMQGGPNNEGLRRAQGQYIAYLGHDDLWMPAHLKNLLQTIKSEAVDFVHAACVMIGEEGVYEAKGTLNRKGDYTSRFIPPSCWLHKRTVVDTCGFWPVDRMASPSGVDFYYQRKLIRTGIRFATCNQLSVIKFPSAQWGLYAKKDKYPQERYLNWMLENSEKLQLKLFGDIALAYLERDESLSILPVLKKLRFNVLWRFKEWYGFERWPLKQIMTWRTKSAFKRRDYLRGLTTK